MQPNLATLSALSQRFGSNPKLVQGPGGNTSLKDGDVLWVKASGTWLAHALEQDIFVPVDMPLLDQQLAQGVADPVAGTVRSDLSASSLRPSIETTLHALLPHRIVVHTHSVRTIAIAIRQDAETVFGEKLDGLRWAFVPYARPGLPLTRVIEQALSKGPFDVLVMGNHGLVVGAETEAEAEALQVDVEQRLSAVPSQAPDANTKALAQIAEDTCFQLPTDPANHRLGTNATMCEQARKGSLYPDHVVFLGPAVTVVEPNVDLTDPAYRDLKMVAVKGHGVLVHQDLNAAGQAMVTCLSDVLSLVPEDAPLTYLTPEQDAELLGWDAEKLRQALNK